MRLAISGVSVTAIKKEAVNTSTTVTGSERIKLPTLLCIISIGTNANTVVAVPLAMAHATCLVPLAAAIRDEQTANARGLVKAGAAILIPESKLDPDSLAAQMISVLSNPDAAVKMAHGALAQGRPDAAEKLAEMVMTLANRKKPE